MFLLFVRPLNRLDIRYMVTGSAASMAYGMPRVTLDLDLVVEMSQPQIRLLPAAFPAEEFYCPPPDIIESETQRPTRGHFNIIHTPTGFKAYCYPIGDDPLHRWAMPRRRRIEMAGEPVMLAPLNTSLSANSNTFRKAALKNTFMTSAACSTSPPIKSTNANSNPCCKTSI